MLLVLFIATALVFFVTRPKDTPAGLELAQPPAQSAPAAPLSQPTAASTVIKPISSVVVSSQTPAPTPTPGYFATTWTTAHPAIDVQGITAQGAIIVDRDSQQVLFDKNMNVRRSPASIMKLVTAMVALDLAKPEQTISVSRDAANMEPNRMGLDAGEQLTVQELMYGMLLDSGNDAAKALADGLPGGPQAFIQKMNDKAASLGLRNSHFVDAAGLDDDNYTTPYDMAVLADAALTGYPTIRTVVSTKQITIPSTATHKTFQPTNLNDLLWDYPGTYGAKVGYTDAADYTIVLAAQKNGRNVLTVLMGSDHHFTEGKILLDWAFGHLPPADLPPAPVKKFAAR